MNIVNVLHSKDAIKIKLQCASESIAVKDLDIIVCEDYVMRLKKNSVDPFQSVDTEKT